MGLFGIFNLMGMATEKKSATEDAKIDLFEDDDEFKEFEVDEEWDDREEGKEAVQQWEDDDDNDDFSLQLMRELESNTVKTIGLAFLSWTMYGY